MSNKKDTSTWLRYLVNIWTLVFFAVILYNFANSNGFEEILGPVAAIYVGGLVIYSAEKEFERWADYYEGRHPGEIYVVAWTILMVTLITSEFIFKFGTKIPSEVVSSYIAVLSIMAITKKSKSLFISKRKRKN